MDRLPRLQTSQSPQPKLHLNGLTPITPFAGSQTPSQDSNDITSPIDARRAKLFSGISRRQTTSNIHDFRYAWSFYHENAASTPAPPPTTTTTTNPSSSSTAYANRLTLLQDDITNPKLFWQVMNNFPFNALKLKDSVHFFKRGVKPVWEDRRNVRGGAWTFRIPKAQAEDFFREVVLMGIGEQFADALQSGKPSFSPTFLLLSLSLSFPPFSPPPRKKLKWFLQATTSAASPSQSATTQT